jgi:hypothetical protein
MLWKEAVVAWFKALPRHLHVRAEENYKNSRQPVEIWTQALQNEVLTSQFS